MLLRSQHRVSPFKLQDPTKPGHRRFIALWLVNPHRRIISTANVPPQRQDWWAEAVFGGDAEAKRGDMPPDLVELILEQGLPRKHDFGQTAGRKLPHEILEMVRPNLSKGLMTAEEARQHRQELINVRSRFHKTSEAGWQSEGYSFCEH